MKKFAISILLLTFVVLSNTLCGQCPPIRGRFSSTYITDLSALYPRVMWLMPSQHRVMLSNGKGKAVFLLPISLIYSTMSNKFPAPSEVLSGRVPRYELIASDVFAQLVENVATLAQSRYEHAQSVAVLGQLTAKMTVFDLLAKNVATLDKLPQMVSSLAEVVDDLCDRVKFQQPQIIVPLPRAAEVIGIHAQTLRHKIAAGLYPSISVEGSPRRFMTQEQIFDVLKRRAQRSGKMRRNG